MKKSKILILMLVIAMSVSFLAGCSAKTANLDEENKENIEEEVINTNEEYGITIDEDTVSFIDGRNQQVTINKNPQRVVVLYNSYLDIWMRNGGSIIGKLEPTVGQDEIPGTEDAPIIGKLGALSIEMILSVEPDLVILNSTQKTQMEVVPALEENNIPIIAIDYIGKEDYFKLGRLFSALNEREDLFEENVLNIEKDINEIIEKAPKDKGYKVLVMMASAKSVTARGSNTYVGMMLDDLNTINIADTSNDTLSDKNFSIEKILEEDPDFIFVQTTGSDMEKVIERLKEDVESNPAWASLSAVKNDRYIILPKDIYMIKANHRYPEAYEGLAKILYPEVFGDN